MKHLLIALGTATLMTTAFTANANLFENALKIAQAVQGGNSTTTQNINSNQKTQQQVSVNTTPLSVSQLSYMDCAALAVTAANAQRDMKNLMGQAENYDALQQQAQQESAANANTKALGGLLSLAGGIMGNKGSSSAETLNTLGNNLSTTQSEAQLKNINSDAIIQQYKKHETDLENIKIYQKSKKCQ